MIDLLKAQLKQDEGVVNRPYQDSVGVWTCGAGWNMQEVVMCEEAIDAQLEYQAKIAIEDARSLFSNFDNLPPVIQAALSNMAFNLGKTRLAGFRKFRAAVERADFEEAAKEALDSKWAVQVGARAKRIAHIFETFNQP